MTMFAYESPLSKHRLVSRSNSNKAAFWLGRSRLVRAEWNFETASSTIADGVCGCRVFGGRILFRGNLHWTKQPIQIEHLGLEMARIDYCDTSKSNDRTRE